MARRTTVSLAGDALAIVEKHQTKLMEATGLEPSLSEVAVKLIKAGDAAESARAKKGTR